MTNLVPPDEQLEKVADYTVSRVKLGVYGAFVGVLLGILNVFLDVDFTPRLALVGWVAAAVVLVVFLHEGTHGAVARLLGHRPIFGLKPPLVYVTFDKKIPRGHLIAIAVAPFLFLDIVFAALYAAGVLKLFWSLCFGINTLGATGDLWITGRVLPQDRGTLVQDTKTGVEIWRIRSVRGEQPPKPV
jgi:hypothetical protein